MVKVGVFPAAGGIGGNTAKYLLPRLPHNDLVFIARSPEKLTFASSTAVTLRKADYDDDSSLQHAFDGIDTLFLISYASVEHEYRSECQKLAIDLAIKSGVKYIFYGSLGFAGKEDNKTSVAHVMLPHLDTERYLETCTRQHPGFAYTVIREGLYSESYPLYTASFDPKSPVDEICIPHDGAGPGISWVKREELGEGTAELLARFVRSPERQDDFKYRGQTVLLSGSRTLTLRESLDVLGKVAGCPRPVRIRQVSDDEYAAQPQVALVYRGVNYARPWASSFEAFRRGEAANVSPLLEELLGRTPEDFETTISNS